MLRVLKLFFLCFGVLPIFSLAEQSLPGQSQIDEAQNHASELFNSKDLISAKSEASKLIGESLKAEAGFDKIKKTDNYGNVEFSKMSRSGAPEWIKKALDGSEEMKGGSYSDKNGVIVLVSMSMPEEQIKSLLDQLPNYNGMMAIRGLVDNDFEKTITKMRGMSSSEMGVAIDPTLFRRFNVKSVPTFILPLEKLEPCQPNKCDAPDAVIASGSMSVKYFLDKVVELNTGKAKDVATEIIESGHE